MRKNCWNTKPIRLARIPDRLRSRRSCTAWPATRTVPDVGRSSVPAMASSVDLPDPDGPVIATNSPAPMLTVTERSATTGGEPGCSLVTPISSSAVASLTVSPGSLLRPLRVRRSLCHHHPGAGLDAGAADRDPSPGENPGLHPDEPVRPRGGYDLHAVTAAGQR